MTAEDEREVAAELIARAIRAGRYSGKIAPGPQPVEWHNPVDLRDGRRVYDELAAAGWFSRPQPITDAQVERVAKALWHGSTSWSERTESIWAGMSEDARQFTFQQARAALEAAQAAGHANGGRA